MMLTDKQTNKQTNQTTMAKTLPSPAHNDNEYKAHSGFIQCILAALSRISLFSSSTGPGKEPPGISGTGFHVLPAIQPTVSKH